MAEYFKPVIGKNVLETLTSGMYDDARFIFREYIQNAADQIDEAVEMKILKDKSKGKIEISIDVNNKKVTVEDNATGISGDSILQFLGDVANSQKDRTQQKGFRGIGRLGGLGYCDKLIFETSFKGETFCSKMTLDAKRLKKIIEDKKDKSDAAAVISIVTTIEREKEEADKHYFRVTLINVFNDKILDVLKVKEYLSMVAPVPFSSAFSFAPEIKKYLNKKNVILDEYNVELNTDTLFKAYKDNFKDENENVSKLIAVDFIDIRNDEQELIAVCWYGYRDISNIVLDSKNHERGIRIRNKNIAIGDESTCKRFFDAERTSLRFIGEIHTISDSFIPNARRDYFNENNTCLQFEKNAKQIFTEENLENNIAQTASKLHNRLKEIENYKSALTEFKSLKGKFDNETTETFHLNKLKDFEEKAKKAKNEIERIDRKGENFPAIKKLRNSVIGNADITIEPISEKELQVSKYDPPTFSKLDMKETKVVLDVFQILEEELDFEESENLKKKIIDKFNK